MLKKGESVRAVVLSVDQEKQRIALGLKQMKEDPWVNVIPANYRPGMVVKGSRDQDRLIRAQDYCWGM